MLYHILWWHIILVITCWSHKLKENIGVSVWFKKKNHLKTHQVTVSCIEKLKTGNNLEVWKVTCECCLQFVKPKVHWPKSYNWAIFTINVEHFHSLELLIISKLVICCDTEMNTKYYCAVMKKNIEQTTYSLSSNYYLFFTSRQGGVLLIIDSVCLCWCEHSMILLCFVQFSIRYLL